MYSLIDYGSMLADSGRMQPYVRALESLIKSDSVVLDLGTGAGIFALLACRSGARHVYAIDSNEAIEVARNLASQHGYADRITFIQDLSTRVTLPEQVSIIISDLRGALPAYGLHLPSIIDARERLLSNGGVLVPARDKLWVALISVPELYQSITSPWTNNDFRISMDTVLQMTTNTVLKYETRYGGNYHLADPLCWAEIDYQTVSEVNFSKTIEFPVMQDETAHGFLVWFDTELVDGIGFSNAPDQTRLIYGSLFFPWTQPVALKKNDTVTINLHADLVADDYLWRWETRIYAGSKNSLKADFKQSTFNSRPISLANLHKHAADYQPALNETAKIDLKILDMMSDGLILQKIAECVAGEFPARFKTVQQALNHVCMLSKKYSE